MQTEPQAGGRTYGGLFLVALATLMYEVLLTRIFSVTMYYHFAFVAVSVALFGMTLGAVVVYLAPRFFAQRRVHLQMSLAALLFGVSVIVTFIIHLKNHYTPSLRSAGLGLWALAGTYSLIAIPFLFSGIAVCLALTRFTRQVSRLYAADLAGAAAGCLLFVAALKLTDGPTAVLLAGALATGAGVLFAMDSASRWLMTLAPVVFLAVAILAAVNGYRVAELAEARLREPVKTAALAKSGQFPEAAPLVRITHAKGGVEMPPLLEQWNSYSRIRVEGDPKERVAPAGWGLSPVWRDDPAVHPTVPQLYISIDAGAGTYMTGFTPRGPLVTQDAREQASFLKYDLTNFAHYLRPGSVVLVIGSGGGRDILSALVFDQKQVIGIEVNEAIVRAMSGVFGDFTGHMDRLPNVQIVQDEARSYIARMQGKADIIQISLIDTWAATAAGAFVLSENSLYTVEAWKSFLAHLNDSGILTVTRWHHARRPGETLRIAGLANQALREMGVSDPRRHIVIVKTTMKQQSEDLPDGVANTLVCRRGFSDGELGAIESLARRLGFEVILSPTSAASTELARMAGTDDVAAAAKDLPINVAPPTNDRPFFFNMARMRDAFAPWKWQGQGNDVNLRAVMVVAGLLVFVVVLTAVFIVVPVALRMDRAVLREQLPLSAFFLCIGLGYILIEIAQMQRLIILLGHPSYALSVVLFGLLVSSGFGSFTTRGAAGDGMRRQIVWRMAVLLGVLLATGALTPVLIHACIAWGTGWRIAVALALLMPAGFFMGMCFPLGMKVAADRKADIAPWLWGINGAMSVVASVLAVVIAMSLGISAAFWTGAGCYGIALWAILQSLIVQRFEKPDGLISVAEQC